MAEYPLLKAPEPRYVPKPRGYGGGGKPRLPSRQRQVARLGPAFERLRRVFDANRDPLVLGEDPSGIAPERALVLEVAGSIDRLQRAINRIPGFEFLGDEEFEFGADEDFALQDTKGVDRTNKPVGGRIYLTMPTAGALQELVRLWGRYCEGQKLDYGFGAFSEMFDSLYRIRAWGPEDRMSEDTIEYLRESLETESDDITRVEVELWSFEDRGLQRAKSQKFEEIVHDIGGVIVDKSSIAEIAYEAMLIELPASEIHRIVDWKDGDLITCDDVMYVRPQSVAISPVNVQASRSSGIDSSPPPEDVEPIAAIFDGMPVQNHSLLNDRLIIDDPDGMESLSQVKDRYHGTQVASLLLHGDLSRENEPSLSRRVYLRPVLYSPGGDLDERSHQDKLLIDTIYRAVLRIKEGDNEGGPVAPGIFIVNLSLGIRARPFAGPITPWARLLDYLADRYGILFLVSAGNISDPLPIDGYEKFTDFEDAAPEEREEAILNALNEQRSQRTLLSPAEALNPITVGAWHEDDQPIAASSMALQPYQDDGPNITSAMGLGHRKTIKPDIYMPGGRELVTPMTMPGRKLSVVPAHSGQRYGLSAAMPDEQNPDQEGLTSGTSMATALASRAAHRLFDALIDEDFFKEVDPMHYGVITKALLVHRARWGDKGILLEDIYGPKGQGSHVAQRDNMTSVLGYGRPNIEEAMSCASNRATLIGWGSINARGPADSYHIPLPGSLEDVTDPRFITLTLAWFSPVNTRHRAYRRAKLEIKQDNFGEGAGVERAKLQPSHASVPRGSLFHVRYEGDEAVTFIDDGHLIFRVFCREQAGALDDSIRYGLVVTIEASEHIPVYQEIYQRLVVPARVTTGTP